MAFKVSAQTTPLAQTATPARSDQPSVLMRLAWGWCFNTMRWITSAIIVGTPSTPNCAAKDSAETHLMWVMPTFAGTGLSSDSRTAKAVDHRS